MGIFRANLFVVVFSLIILSSGIKGPLAAQISKFDPTGEWDIVVQPLLVYTDPNDNQPPPFPARLRIAISPQGDNFSIKIVAIEATTMSGANFPKSLDNVRLRGNTLHAETEINSETHKIVLNFDEETYELTGIYKSSAVLIVLPYEETAKITGRLSHREMLSLLDSNRRSLRNSCDRKVTRIQNFHEHELTIKNGILSSCKRNIGNLESEKEALNDSLDTQVSKNKILSKNHSNVGRRLNKTLAETVSLKMKLKNEQTLRIQKYQDNNKLKVDIKSIQQRLEKTSGTLQICEERAEDSNKYKPILASLRITNKNLQQSEAKQINKVQKLEKYRKNLRQALREQSRRLKLSKAEALKVKQDNNRLKIDIKEVIKSKEGEIDEIIKIKNGKIKAATERLNSLAGSLTNCEDTARLVIKVKANNQELNNSIKSLQRQRSDLKKGVLDLTKINDGLKIIKKELLGRLRTSDKKYSEISLAYRNFQQMQKLKVEQYRKTVSLQKDKMEKCSKLIQLKTATYLNIDEAKKLLMQCSN